MTLVQTCDKCGKKDIFTLGARIERWELLLSYYDLCEPCRMKLYDHISKFFKNEVKRP